MTPTGLGSLLSIRASWPRWCLSVSRSRRFESGYSVILGGYVFSTKACQSWRIWRSRRTIRATLPPTVRQPYSPCDEDFSCKTQSVLLPYRAHSPFSGLGEQCTVSVLLIPEQRSSRNDAAVRTCSNLHLHRLRKSVQMLLIRSKRYLSSARNDAIYHDS